MKILGHKSAGMSMTYASISDPVVLADYQSVLQPGAVGHCLRLPQEGPCECDLYLTCAKFVTTPQYAPRLRERLCLEGELADDARERGWEREADRHERVASRIRGLLAELDEPAGQDEQS